MRNSGKTLTTNPIKYTKSQTLRDADKAVHLVGKKED